MTQRENDAIDAALRTAELPIADDGFSDRVLASLPPRKRRRTVSRRWTLAVAAGTGSLLTIVLAPSIEALGLALPYVGMVPVLTALVFAAVVAAPLLWIMRSE
jgi:anti-sigma factor RsiW